MFSAQKDIRQVKSYTRKTKLCPKIQGMIKNKSLQHCYYYYYYWKTLHKTCQNMKLQTETHSITCTAKAQICVNNKLNI